MFFIIIYLYIYYIILFLGKTMLKCLCQIMAKEVFDMNKIKQIFKFSTFALLSCFLAGSGFLLSTINPTPTNAQVVEENISNNTPVFFSNGGYESEVYFSPTGSTSAIVKFDFIAQADRNADDKDDYIYKFGDTTVYPEDDGYVEPTTNYTNYEKIKIYRYYPDGLNADGDPINPNHYYYIDINSIAISLNGIPLTYHNNVDDDTDDGAVVDTGDGSVDGTGDGAVVDTGDGSVDGTGDDVVVDTGDGSVDGTGDDVVYGTVDNFILESNAPSYFDESFFPESLNFEIALDTTTNPIEADYNAEITASNGNDPALLTIYQEGLLNINVGYTLYDVNLTSTVTGAPTETQTTLTGQSLNYSIFLFNNTSYFESESSQNPNVIYGEKTTRTPSNSATHSYNYFYNYTSKSLPYISYDPYKYDLTITKSLNNTTSSETIEFNPETKEFKVPSFVYNAVLNENSLTIYFNDLGLYNLHFSMKYSFTTTSATSGTTTHVYDLSTTVKDQMFYVYGAQMYYTNYETGAFSEFKSIKENSIVQSADITNRLEDLYFLSGTTKIVLSPYTGQTIAKGETPDETNNHYKLYNFLESNTPVVTDQTPVKISTYASNVDATLYTKTETETETGWDRGSTISTTKNISEDGTYLLALEYNFANYTNSSGLVNASEEFYQYFYFKIEKETPIVNVEKQTSTNPEQFENLASGKYTNQNVKISYGADTSEFDADVYIYLSRYSFTNSTTPLARELIYPKGNITLGEYQKDDSIMIYNGNNGKYVLEIYYGKNALDQKPITRSFIIDTEEISGLQAYTIASVSKKYYAESLLESQASNVYGVSTNQPFAFGWENTKPSGAKTQAWVKYFPLKNYDDYYTGASAFGTLVYELLSSDTLAVAKRLDLKSASNWTEYTNSSVYPLSSIPAENVKSPAGLYVFEIFDDAGNTTTAYVFNDNSSPVFMLEKEGLGYSLISNNETINSNATVYWSDTKAIYVDLPDGTFAYDTFSDSLIKNKNEQVDEKLTELFNDFIGGASQTNIKTFEFLPNNRNGTYLIVDILDQIAFAERSPENLVLTTFETNSYDIQFSYSIHYTQSTDGTTTFYRSTTVDDNTYENIETGENFVAYNGMINNLELKDAIIYQTLTENGSRLFYYGEQNASTLTRLDTGAQITFQIQGEEIIIEGLVATSVEFVDMEGTYSFLVRDASNTKGLNEQNLLTQLSAYPSASQYITVSADTSSVQINYKDDSNKSNQLFLAGYYSTNGSGNTSQRSSFYTPTSYEGVLEISYKPTVESTQIDKLILRFYPYETKMIAHKSASGEAKISFYQTLSETYTDFTVYDFDRDGSFTSDTTRTYQINPSENLTTAGKYVLTRTYKTGESYTVDKFDYATRNLTAIVDRTNVISESQAVTANSNSYILKDEEGISSDYTLTIYGNLFVLQTNNNTVSPISAETTFVGLNSPENEYYNDVNKVWTKGNARYFIMPEDFVFTSLDITYKDKTYTTNGVIPTKNHISTLESVVGGDMFVNMYDDQAGEAGSILSVTFPNVSITDKIVLGSGESFYTGDQSNLGNQSPSPMFETNKLPVKVYIPQYKYTIYNDETDAVGKVSYQSKENPLLSYYDQQAQSISSISAYKLYATITSNNGTVYYSNGTDENGYLKFTNSNGEVLKELTEAGTYTVTITQNYNGSGSGTANDFRKTYKFSFNIQETKPEFDLASAGRELKTLGNENYYTNQKSVTFSWRDGNSDYIANIDKSKIKLQFSNNYPDMIIDVSSTSPNVTLASDGSQNESTSLIASALDYNQSGLNHTLTLDFEKANIYNQNMWIDVTMQYVGHNDEYYQVTTKRVTIDKIASYDTLDSLISKLTPFSSSYISFDDSSLRNYYDVEGMTVTNKNFAAYNTTVSSGNLKYYSYIVNKQFLQELTNKIANNNSPLHSGNTVYAYYREINPYDGTFTETTYDNFVESNFKELNANLIIENQYYEIVEQDLAGNLTIYLIYLYADNNNGFDGTIDEYGNVCDIDGNSIDASKLQGIQFTDGERFVQISDAQILAQLSSNRVVEMFSSKNFNLKEFNLRGDVWLTLTVSNQNYQTKTYLFSPWLSSTRSVIDMQTGNQVSYEQIFNDFTSGSASSLEISLEISNRADGGKLKAELNLANGASLSATYSDSQTEEYLSIRRSTLVYPVEIKIQINNDEFVYKVKNDPNALNNLLNSSYSYLNNWADSKIAFTYDSERLTYKFITTPANNTKVRYQIRDNFGNVSTLIHIFGETYFEPISSTGNLYQDLISNPTLNDGSEDYFISYVSSENITYRYNSSIYFVKAYYFNGSEWEATEDYSNIKNGNIVAWTFSIGEDLQVDKRFKLCVYEKPADPDEDWMPSADEQPVDTIFLHIYEMRPELNTEDVVADYKITFSDHYGENITGDLLDDSTTIEYLTINGKQHRVTKQGSTFALNLTITYTDPSSLSYPYEVLYYHPSTMENFEPLSSGTRVDETGIYYFLIKYVQNENSVLSNEYELYKVEIVDSAQEFYRVTNNGVNVERAPVYYTYQDTEYSDYYIVNVNYNQDSASVQIVPNVYQQVKVDKTVVTISEGSGVVTVRYHVTNYVDNSAPSSTGVSAFDRYVFISYIPPTNSPVTSAVYYYNENEQFNLLGSSSINAIVSNENTSQDKVTLRWAKSYGISTNLVYVNILKDGIQFFNSEPSKLTDLSKSLVSYYSKDDYNYVTLDRSGTYTISLYDEAGNKQSFTSSIQSLKFIFLKDVAFSMTYLDPATGIEVVSDPTQKGIFNNEVVLTVLNMTEYYTASSTGSGENIIRAYRNGVAYNGYEYDAQSHSFRFSSPGYYTVSFVATSQTGQQVRQQVYNFTIINPNESRYSFEFAPYQDYYITSIVKDNLGDISGQIIKNMNDYNLNLQTVLVNGTTYLRELITSYFGIGSGRYTVTISTNKPFDRADYSTPTQLTFSYWINSATVPIDINIAEGESTSSPINVTFNAERIYDAVGECTITIGNNTYYITSQNASGFGVVSAPPIEQAGTHFITVRSMSGNLLFSYKVIKTDPLNGWAIAAIVIGCVVAIVAVILIIKLRKKIRVK